MSMVERTLYEIIKEGLDYFKDPLDEGRRFERFVRSSLGLSADEAAKARSYFAGGEVDGETISAKPPTLHHGYPRTGGPFPVWAITLGGEHEVTEYLGADLGLLDTDGDYSVDPESGEIVRPEGLRIEYVFNILCITDHPDIVLYYYGLLKFILRSQRLAFIRADLDVPSISGADLAPDPRYLPSDMFARQLTVTIQGDEVWTEAIEGGFAQAVSGISVDDAGSGVTSEGTIARVVPYVEA